MHIAHIILAAMVLAAPAAALADDTPAATGPKVVIATSMGDITLQLEK